MSLGTFLLLHVFTALLPPTDEDDPADEYYALLGFENKGQATHEEIRKAYKQISLRLHPDKVAQRRGGGGTTTADKDDDDLAKQYHDVQEAYGVLSDPKHRREYALLGYSPTRYRFINQGGISNPAALYQNLAGASIRDKTRLVALVTLFLMLVLMQPILIAAKVNAVIYMEGGLHDAKWTAILTPFWLAYSAYWVIRAWLVPRNLKPYAIVEDFCWLTGFILMAVNWDRVAATDGPAPRNWNVVAVPFYFALLARMSFLARAAANLLDEQSKMCSLPYLEEHHLNRRKDTVDGDGVAGEGDGTTGQQERAGEEGHEVQQQEDETKFEDLSEERRAEILEDHVVVSVDDDAVLAATEALRSEGHDITDDDIEALRVRSSVEFQESEHAISMMGRQSGNIIVWGFMFIALVATKAEGQIGANWWVVFLPVWFYLGIKMSAAMVTCCCFTVGNEVVVIGDGAGDDGDDNQDGEDEETGAAGTKSAAAVASSVNYADAEGKMNEFNKEKKKSGTTAVFDTRPIADDDAPSDEENGFAPREDREKETGAALLSSPSVEMVAGNDEGTLGIVSSNGVMQGVTNDEADDDTMSTDVFEGVATKHDGDEKKEASTDGQDGRDGQDEEIGEDSNIRVDEETYQAWKDAQEEADHSAMEAQAKAQSSCCWVLFQFMIVCLIVGKLEHDWRNPNPVTDPGYSAFWVLFPVFLIVGVILCCCSCLIYGAGGNASLDEFVERAQHNHQEDDENNNSTDGKDINNTGTSQTTSPDVGDEQMMADGGDTGTQPTSGATTSLSDTAANPDPKSPAAAVPSLMDEDDVESGQDINDLD